MPDDGSQVRTQLRARLRAQLREQIVYYRDRAPEYDDWFYQRGRYDRGERRRREWLAEVVKIYYTVPQLQALFAEHGFRVEVTTTPTLWIAVAGPAPRPVTPGRSDQAA